MMWARAGKAAVIIVLVVAIVALALWWAWRRVNARYEDEPKPGKS